VLALALALSCETSSGQQAQPSPAESAKEKAVESAGPAKPVAIPLSELAVQAEAASATLHQIEAALAADDTISSITAELPGVTREIDARQRESARIAAQRPSLDLLRNLEQGWQTLNATLETWTRELDEEIARLDKELAHLARDEQIWRETLKLTRPPDATPELAARVEQLLAAIAATRRTVEKRKAEATRLQNRVTAQDFRVADAVQTIRRARERMVSRLFLKDSPPVWALGKVDRPGEQLALDTQESLSAQVTALKTYAGRRGSAFALHGAILAVVIAAMYWLRRRAAVCATGNPALQRAASALAVPVATALVLTFMASRWMYPQAPRLLWAVIGVAALIPTVIVLRRLVAPALLPVLYGLVAFFFVDQARAVTASLPLVPRLVFLAEMAAGACFCVWLLFRMRGGAPAPASAPVSHRGRRIFRIAAGVAGLSFAAAAAANALGYVAFGNLLGSAVLRSGYFGIVLYALAEILSALTMIASHLRPLTLLRIVEQHRDLLWRRTRLLLYGIAALWWALFVLDRLMLREKVVGGLEDMLTAELETGSISISAGDIIVFGLVVWASFLVSRFLRFILDEEIYPHAHLQRGLPYAISNTLHYAILVTGFLVAVAAMGFDMTKFTILAGAFTVGVGFGLQNIFNNFVSGIILLFERPVQIGDMIQLDDATTGIVEHIGIRASVLRSTSGSEIIVPNSKLISERVINWTLSDRQRTIEVPVSVAHGANPKLVIETMERVATAHPLVLKQPPPEALLVKPGPDWMGFQLHARTDRVEEWMKVRSDLAVAITDALAAEKITMK
jgi:small-conductance mechanosensitive channel